MTYKTELHCHTDFSGCSDVSAAGMVDKYVAAGYSTVVVTNHFNAYHLMRERSFENLVRGTFATIDEIRELAEGRLNIIPGIELTLRCMPNDFLLYGITEEFIAGIGEELFDLRPWQVRDKLNEVGGLIVQAHPFRFGQTVVNPEEVHGIEVFNGHMGQRSNNEIAQVWADYWVAHHEGVGAQIFTSGTDHHHTWQQPVGGIETESPITTSEELVAVLNSGSFKRITSDLGDVTY